MILLENLKTLLSPSASLKLPPNENASSTFNDMIKFFSIPKNNYSSLKIEGTITVSFYPPKHGTLHQH